MFSSPGGGVESIENVAHPRFPPARIPISVVPDGPAVGAIVNLDAWQPVGHHQCGFRAGRALRGLLLQRGIHPGCGSPLLSGIARWRSRLLSTSRRHWRMRNRAACNKTLSKAVRQSMARLVARKSALRFMVEVFSRWTSLKHRPQANGVVSAFLTERSPSVDQCVWQHCVRRGLPPGQ